MTKVKDKGSIYKPFGSVSIWKFEMATKNEWDKTHPFMKDKLIISFKFRKVNFLINGFSNFMKHFNLRKKIFFFAFKYSPLMLLMATNN